MFKTFICVALFSSTAFAFTDYDVDFEPSEEPGLHIVRVTIDNCVTKFKVKDKDFKSFTKSDSALQQLVDLAIDRAANGCK